MLFLFVSFAKPLPRLAPRKPPSVLSPYLFCTVLAQFGVHLFVLIQALNYARAHIASGPLPDRDADFEPDVRNTVVWLISVAMLVTNFGVNYKGKPYMEALSANRGLMASLVGSAALITTLTSGWLPDLYSYLELEALPSAQLQSDLMGLMGLDFFLCWIFEKIVSNLSCF